MCGPAAALGFGLSAASSIAGFAGQQQETKAYNQTAANNRRDAVLAANRGYEDEGVKFIYNQHQNQQETYDAIMKARQASGTLQASAGSAGFDASSLSVSDLVSESNRAEGRDTNNFLIKTEDNKNAFDSRVASINADAQGRINSMPFKKGPSALALGLNIAKAGLDSVGSTTQGKTWLGTG